MILRRSRITRQKAIHTRFEGMKVISSWKARQGKRVPHGRSTRKEAPRIEVFPAQWNSYSKWMTLR